MTRHNRARSLCLAAATLLLGACAQQPLSSKGIDDVVRSAMQQFQVPGAVVGVVKDGEIVHSAGYGVIEIGKPERVDEETLFRIASTTKAMTAASLAILVDEGRLAWDDKVKDHIPAFQLYDPWITEHFTVTDLLTHRSGLAPYTGDLMLWPKPNNFTRKDILYGLRYFKPSREFRLSYDYDNLLYIIAGELVPAVTGQAWEEFVDERMFGRLGMRRCFAGPIPDVHMTNLAVPHSMIEGALQVVERNRIRAHTDVAAAAGGIRCSLSGMLRWIELQLANGTLPDGSELFSEEQSRYMRRPQTVLSVSEEEIEQDRTHFKAYGLGWRLIDVHGYKQVRHTGSLDGFRAWVVLVPEIELGAVVLLNASSGSARAAIMKSIIWPYLGQHGVDWIDYYVQEEAEATEANGNGVEIDYENGAVDRELQDYAGIYSEPWFGDVSITLVEDQLWFAAAKSPNLTGRMWPQQGDTFMVRWEDRSAERDIFVDFVSGESGEFTRLEVRCLREEIKCAFRDQEMNFTRIENVGDVPQD
jgi:CubicO group peptidase (beta-lactamase class C family)